MKRITLVIISMFLIFVMTLNLSGCGNSIKAKDLMKGITAQSVDSADDLTNGNAIMTDFAIRLFKECENADENTLVSPLSVMYALSMTANGADGATLSQIEEVLGMQIDDLNNYLYSYKESLAQGEKYKLNLANSIWIKDGFDVKQDFLQANANYYKADIYQSSFDKSTLKDINYWVNTKTNEIIPQIIDEIDSDTVMYLINALAFESEWDEKYAGQKIKSGTFTREDGTSENVTLMYSDECSYLHDDNAEGFIKYYTDDKYAFVALLPNYGITVSEYINSLDSTKVNELLSNPQSQLVDAAIPKFEIEYTAQLPDTLKKMGITDAFSPNADFSKLGYGVYVGQITHKTFITVNENGTSAGAATSVGLKKAIANDKKTIHLNRPFMYMIIDCENNVPFFIGTVMSIES